MDLDALSLGEKRSRFKVNPVDSSVSQLQRQTQGIDGHMKSAPTLISYSENAPRRKSCPRVLPLHLPEEGMHFFHLKQ